MTFDQLGLSAELLRAVREEGYTTPTPVQEKSIPVILQGRDLLAVSKAGRGETASFALPILQSLHQSGPEHGTFIKALIVVPTSETAIRIGYSIQKYSRTLGEIRTKMVFGGVSVKSQMKGLRGADILVATPDRLLELIDCEAVDLSKVDTLVLASSEKLADPESRNDLDTILDVLPKKRQNLIYCTSLSDDVRALAEQLLRAGLMQAVGKQQVSLCLSCKACINPALNTEHSSRHSLLYQRVKRPSALATQFRNIVEHWAK